MKKLKTITRKGLDAIAKVLEIPKYSKMKRPGLEKAIAGADKFKDIKLADYPHYQEDPKAAEAPAKAKAKAPAKAKSKKKAAAKVLVKPSSSRRRGIVHRHGRR